MNILSVTVVPSQRFPADVSQLKQLYLVSGFRPVYHSYTAVSGRRFLVSVSQLKILFVTSTIIVRLIKNSRVRGAGLSLGDVGRMLRSP